MRSTWLMKIISTSFRHGRRLCGLALIMAACAGGAMARNPLTPLPTPEIDLGSLSSGLALLTGGILLLSGRARKK